MTSLSILRSSLLAAALLAAPLVHARPGEMPEPPPAHAGEPRPPLFLPPGLQQLGLSEAQQDQLFKLQHQQAPALYAQHKAARQARDALQALSLAADFSPARARELARSVAQAEAEIALLQAALMHDSLAVLNAEQRQALAEAQPPVPQGRPPLRGQGERR